MFTWSSFGMVVELKYQTMGLLHDLKFVINRKFQGVDTCYLLFGSTSEVCEIYALLINNVLGFGYFSVLSAIFVFSFDQKTLLVLISKLTTRIIYECIESTCLIQITIQRNTNQGPIFANICDTFHNAHVVSTCNLCRIENVNLFSGSFIKHWKTFSQVEKQYWIRDSALPTCALTCALFVCTNFLNVP